MSGTRIKVLFPIDENVPMNKCYEATSNESMYDASMLDVLEDEAEKGHTLRDCLHSGNECLKNKVLEYIYDTLVNMFNCTFEDTNDGITGTDGLYAVSETFDKNLCNILGEDVPDSILQIALDMQTDNLTAVENKLEKMQVLGKTVNQKLISVWQERWKRMAMAISLQKLRSLFLAALLPTVTAHSLLRTVTN